MKGWPQPQEPNAAGRSILPSNNSFHPDPHRLRRIGLVKLNVEAVEKVVLEVESVSCLRIMGSSIGSLVSRERGGKQTRALGHRVLES